MRKFTTLFIASIFGCTLTANAQWTALATGSTASVSAIAVSGTDIYAGSGFTSSSGAFSFGKFSSGQWSHLGNWLNFPNGTGSVFCAVAVGDDIYVGGTFTDAAGNPDMDRIARWNITSQTWHALGTGLNAQVNAIAVSGTDIYVGGRFTDAGGVAAADYIAKWDGTSWSALGTGVGGNSLSSVNAVAINGSNVYIGTNFENIAGVAAADYLAKFDGTSWSDVGGWGASVGAIFDIKFATNGDLYIAGEFTPARLAKYNGTNWLPVGDNLNQRVNTMAFVGSDLYIGGNFTSPSGNGDASYLAKLNGTSWESVGGGFLNNAVSRLVVSGTNIIVGGTFTDAGGNTNADRIAILATGSNPPSSIVENSKIDFEIFPNPNNGNFTLSLPENSTYNMQVMDMTGKTVYFEKVNESLNSKPVILKNVLPGIYFVKIESAEGQVSIKKINIIK